MSLAKEADVFLVAPASANVIGKLAHGIADDMLTTTFMACTCPKIISPAMNTRMYENPITQDNLKILEHYGMEVIRPASGYLACGDTGAGKMPEPETLFEYILRTVGYPKDMVGKKVLITAGPTREAIDPGTLYHQSFYRENGLCHCKGSCLQRSRGDFSYRTSSYKTTYVCKGDSC